MPRPSGVRGDSGVEARSATRGVVPRAPRLRDTETLRSLVDIVRRECAPAGGWQFSSSWTQRSRDIVPRCMVEFARLQLGRRLCVPRLALVSSFRRLGNSNFFREEASAAQLHPRPATLPHFAHKQLPGAAATEYPARKAHTAATMGLFILTETRYVCRVRRAPVRGQES